jgi:hypothetical protein
MEPTWIKVVDMTYLFRYARLQCPFANFRIDWTQHFFDLTDT